MTGNPRLTLADVKVGTAHEAKVVDNLSRTQIVQYAAGSGDFNPIHHDETFATKVAGYPSVFAHGMLTMGLTGRMLTDWLGDGVLKSFGVRFVKQVFPGDSLVAKATVKEVQEQGGEGLVELELVTVNQRGEPVVQGSATAVLPR
ncbi:MAG TPA: MaoC/PaaZ C-terminal domain-containing protein [Myxococcota bacterium]|jgi:acyl dehydratase|nr:MaoC/PaaZ C-terminal domain-containing protein [Myxococcota bacterium]